MGSKSEVQIGAKTWRKWRADKWLSDADLQVCTLASKGLWIDMLSLMMISSKPGYLVDARGRGIPCAELARLVRAPVDQVEKCLAELREHRVFSIDRRGRIFSRRIIREEDLEKIGRESANKRHHKTPRNQGGTFQPTTPPRSNDGARDRDRDRDRKKGAQERSKDLKGSTTSQPELPGTTQPAAAPPASAVPSTLPEPPKRTSPFTRVLKQANGERDPGAMTTDQKRAFAWGKVAEKLGNTPEAWELIASASEGNTQALEACQAVAKEIGVTWYKGAPNTPAPSQKAQTA